MFHMLQTEQLPVCLVFSVCLLMAAIVHKLSRLNVPIFLHLSAPLLVPDNTSISQNRQYVNLQDSHILILYSIIQPEKTTNQYNTLLNEKKCVFVLVCAHVSLAASFICNNRNRSPPRYHGNCALSFYSLPMYGASLFSFLFVFSLSLFKHILSPYFFFPCLAFALTLYQCEPVSKCLCM